MRPLGIGGKTGGGQEEGLGNHLLGQPVPCWSTSNKKLLQQENFGCSKKFRLRNQYAGLNCEETTLNLTPENTGGVLLELYQIKKKRLISLNVV